LTPKNRASIAAAPGPLVRYFGLEIDQPIATQAWPTIPDMRDRLWLNLSLIWVAILLIAIPLILFL
jgi:hypothetical protein